VDAPAAAGCGLIAGTSGHGTRRRGTAGRKVRTDEALVALREARETCLLGYPAEHPDATSIATLIERLQAQAPKPPP
jgi:hypothetical protein